MTVKWQFSGGSAQNPTLTARSLSVCLRVSLFDFVLVTTPPPPHILADHNSPEEGRLRDEVSEVVVWGGGQGGHELDGGVVDVHVVARYHVYVVRRHRRGTERGLRLLYNSCR